MTMPALVVKPGSAPGRLVPLWSALKEDFRFCREICSGGTAQALLSYGIYPTALYRVGRRVDCVSWRPLRRALLIPYHLVRIPMELAFGISIARTAEIGVPVMFHHFGGVFIAPGSVIGSRCQIFQSVTVGESGGRRAGRPVIGDDVIIGVGAKVLGPVRVGQGARIGANAVVISDVPARTLAVGVPAVVRLSPAAQA
jgi:serine O-acetyltransferase